MKVLILLILLSFSTSTLARDSEFREALALSQKAIMQYTIVKNKVKYMERTIYNYSPVDKDYLVPIGVFALTLASGKISTKALKLKRQVFKATIKPHFLYNMRSREIQLSAGVTWDF